MSAVMDIYSLIKDLMDEAEKNKNEQLVSKLIVIEKQVNELDKENQELKKTLDIQEKRIWDDNNMSFTLPENPKVDKQGTEECEVKNKAPFSLRLRIGCF